MKKISLEDLPEEALEELYLLAKISVLIEMLSKLHRSLDESAKTQNQVRAAIGQKIDPELIFEDNTEENIASEVDAKADIEKFCEKYQVNEVQVLKFMNLIREDIYPKNAPDLDAPDGPS